MNRNQLPQQVLPAAATAPGTGTTVVDAVVVVASHPSNITAERRPEDATPTTATTCYIPRGNKTTTENRARSTPGDDASLCCPRGYTCLENGLCAATEEPRRGRPRVKRGSAPRRGACADRDQDGEACGGSSCLDSDSDDAGGGRRGPVACGSAEQGEDGAGTCRCAGGGGALTVSSAGARTVVGKRGVELARTASYLVAAADASQSTTILSPSSSSHSFSLTGIQTVVPTYPPFTTPASIASSSSSSSSSPSRDSLAAKLSLGLSIPLAVLLIIAAVVLLHRRQRRRLAAALEKPPAPAPPPDIPEMAATPYHTDHHLLYPHASAAPSPLQLQPRREGARYTQLLDSYTGGGGGSSSSRRQARRASSVYSADLRPRALSLPGGGTRTPALPRRSGARLAGRGGPLSSNPPALRGYYDTNNHHHPPPPPRPPPRPAPDTAYLSPYTYLQHWRPSQVSPIQEGPSTTTTPSSPSRGPSSPNEHQRRSPSAASRDPLPPPESRAYPYLSPYGRWEYWLPSPSSASAGENSDGGAPGGPRGGDPVPDVQVSAGDSDSSSDAGSQTLLPIQHPPPLAVARPRHLAVDVSAVQRGTDEVSPLSSSESGPPSRPGRVSAVSGLSPR